MSICRTSRHRERQSSENATLGQAPKREEYKPEELTRPFDHLSFKVSHVGIAFWLRRDPAASGSDPDEICRSAAQQLGAARRYCAGYENPTPIQEQAIPRHSDGEGYSRLRPDRHRQNSVVHPADDRYSCCRSRQGADAAVADSRADAGAGGAGGREFRYLREISAKLSRR